jgi:UPF0755 protein
VTDFQAGRAGYHDEAGYDDDDYYGEAGGVHDEDFYEDGGEADWAEGERVTYRRGRGVRRGGGGTRSRRSRPILTTLVILVALMVVVVGGGLLWAQDQINPGGHRGPTVSVVIPAGASTTRIGDILASAGVIHNGTLFAYYVKLHGDGPLLPGSYSLSKNSPYSAAIAALSAGPKIVTANLVIPEGFTLHRIAEAVAALPNMNLSAQKFLLAAEDGAVRSPYEPAGTDNLEGLLFPATYQVRQGDSEVDILEKMVGAFNDRAAQIGLTAAAARLGYTPYQLVTVASIVEREAKLVNDRGPVASTIYNRLRIGMPLGADSTQTYYLRLTDPSIQPTPAQLDQPSPFNTRTNKGLPPTPISNPGLASLEAATNPPATHDLYFVEINPDGQLGFASTQSGFYELERQCQAVHLC